MPAEATYCVRSKPRGTYLSQRVAVTVLRLGSLRDVVRAQMDGVWWVDEGVPRSRALVAKLTAADAARLVALFAAAGGWPELVVVPVSEWGSP